MKKKLFMLLLAGCATLAANAQYLPNVGFNSWKTACGSTEAFGSGSMSSPKTGEMRQRPGVEPADWNGSSINQKVIMTKEETLIFNEGNTVKMQNKFVGVNLGLGSIGSVAPGYITLGTPWVYAIKTVSECFGGTYGGVEFNKKPDAIIGRYKRTDSNDENSYIIVYLWSGEYKSKVGSKSSPDQERTDVDRAIMGTATATSKGVYVGGCNYAFKSTTNKDWQEIEVPIAYENGVGRPTKMNVVISGGDYWTRDNLVDGTTLYADDINFVYYSQLSDLKFNGATLAGFNKDTYAYEVEGMYTEGCLTYTIKGVAATTEGFVYNEATKTATCVVRNEDDGSSHTYTVKFNTPTYDYADGSAFEVAPGVYNVKINRTFNAGWSTICLPFATTTSALGAGVKAQALSSASETTLSFTGTETLEANKPYLVYFPSAVNSLSFTEVTVEEQAPVVVTFGAWTFEGTYAASKLMSGLYGVAKQNGEDKILMGGTNAQMKATRAFFSTTAANVKEMGIEIDGVATAIDNVELAGKKTFDVYSVSGALMRQGATSLNGLHSGLYIINGKKVLVK